MPTINTTWGELFDQVADLELDLERVDEQLARTEIERRLELLRDMARTDAPGAVHALASELKDVGRELREMDGQLTALEAQDNVDAGYATLARAFRQQTTRRQELKSSIDHLMRGDDIEENDE